MSSENWLFKGEFDIYILFQVVFVEEKVKTNSTKPDQYRIK